jgi:methanogenic corrinoid protein MtbC1
LGELWDNDKISFLQVTLGITRLFGLMRMLRMNLPTPRITRKEPILFAAVPGEQHTMGLEMAVELFRQRGWDVEMMLDADEAEVLAELDASGSRILGLSSAGRKTAEAMAHLIFMVRATRPHVHVMVSGQIVAKEPDLVALMNADSTLACVEDALAAMDRLCSGQTAAS